MQKRMASSSAVGADTEAADGAQALAESADGEIHIGLNPGGLRGAATGVAQHAHGVSLVHQQVAAVFTFYRGDFLQRGDIAQHGVNALGDDQCLAGAVTRGGASAWPGRPGRCACSG